MYIIFHSIGPIKIANSKQTYNVYFKYKEMTTIKFKPLKNRDNIVLEVMSNKLKSHTNTKSKLFGSLSD